MKYVSSAYMNSMQDSIRNPSHLQIEVQNVVVDSASQIDRVEPVSDWGSDFDYKIVEPNKNTYSWYDGDLNGFVIGDTKRFSEYANFDESFRGLRSDNVIRRITIRLASPETIHKISLFKDFYDDTTKVRTVSDVMINNSSVSYTFDYTTQIIELEKPVSNAVTIELYVDSKLAPYQTDRFDGILLGEIYTFTDDNITSARWTDEVDPIARRLPIHDLSFTVIDFEGKFDALNKKSDYQFINTDTKTILRYGYETSRDSIEWLDPDLYFLSSKPTFANSKATFTASKMPQSFREKNVTDTVSINTLMARRIEAIELTRGKWDIEWDNACGNIVIDGALKYEELCNTLQKLANATGGCLYFKDGKAWIERFKYHSVPFTLSKDNIYIDTERMTVNPEIKYLDVNYSTFSEGRSVEITDASKTKFILGEHTVLPFNGIYKNTIMVSTGAIPYDTANIGHYAMEFDVVRVDTSADWGLSGTAINEQKQIWHCSNSATGVGDTISNDYMNHLSDIQEVIKKIWLPYMNKRNVIECDYRGNPELEVGDVFTYIDKYGNIRKVVLLSNTITYNGAIRGTMRVKEI